MSTSKEILPQSKLQPEKKLEEAATKALALQLNRRSFLNLSASAALGILLTEQAAAAPPDTAQVPQTPDINNLLYLPQIVEEERYIDQSRMIYEAIKPYYPNLEQERFLLLVKGEEEQPGLSNSIRAWRYWIDRMYQPYQTALQNMANAGIENKFFQTTNERFYLNLMPSYAIAVTKIEDNEEGEVVGIELESHYGFPGAIIGEWLHLVNNIPQMNTGLTRVGIEGASTLVHYELLIKWLADNLVHLDQNTPENAIVMPIFDRVSDTEAKLVTDPSLQEFHDLLFKEAVEVLGLINESANYLYRYTSMDQFGVHKKLQGGMQLLDTYSGKLPGNEYHVTIENFANRFALEAHPHVETEEDIVLLAGLAVQGQDYPMENLPEPVRKALQAWYDRGLLYDRQQWQEVIDKYSQINVPDVGQAIHPVLSAKAGLQGLTHEITIFAYVSQRWSDGEADYQELPESDYPTTARLSFQHPNLAGENQWWNLDVPVTPLHEYGTFVFKSQLPETVILESIVPRPVSLEGKQLVLSVNIDTIAGVPMTYNVEHFELIGHYQAAKAASSQNGEAPIAEPATAPETSQAVSATAVTLESLSLEQQQYLQKPEKSGEEQIIFGPDSNPLKVTVSEDLQTSTATEEAPQIELGPRPEAWNKDEWEELRQTLQAILDKRRQKVE